MNEELALMCVELITHVGTARSCYIEAIQEAKKGDFDQAQILMEQGSKEFVEGHRAHAGLISKEAAGESTEISLLLIHAEDQLMSAEGFKMIAEEFIELYQRFEKFLNKTT